MRPLTVTSENPDDNNIIPLTPCHLTIGDAIKPLPSEIYFHEEKEKKITTDLKERWKEKTSFQPLLEFMERRISHNIAQTT